MEKKFSKETLFSIFSCENTFANTCKFAASVVMAMFFTTFFASCTGESLQIDPTAAQSLMADSASQRGLGWHLFTVAATAVDKGGNAIAANLSIRYEGDKTTYVDSEEKLGLPVTMAFEDGNTFKTTDGINISRAENHSGNAVIGVYGGNFSGGFLGARLNDTTQVCYVQLADSMSIKANDMPSSFASEWKAKKISVVEYRRIWRKPAPAPAPTIETTYRLRAEYVETEGGNSYYNVFAEKSIDGGSTWTEIDKYLDFMAERHGTWSPNVATQYVSSYEFTTEDTTKSLATDEDRPNLGKSKRWTVKNLSKIEYFWKDVFNAPTDADGNKSKDIAGTQVQWINGLIWSNPETGEDMPLNFTGGITTTHSVDKTTGIYTRVNSVLCNGEVVETQTGSVQLELAQ